LLAFLRRPVALVGYDLFVFDHSNLYAVFPCMRKALEEWRISIKIHENFSVFSKCVNGHKIEPVCGKKNLQNHKKMGGSFILFPDRIERLKNKLSLNCHFKG
jgi:hypothetical protein